MSQLLVKLPINRHLKYISILSSVKFNNNTNLINKRNFNYEATVASIFKTISNSAPVACLQDGLHIIHDTTGLPWWSTIIISTICLRTFITLPFTIYQKKITNRIELCGLEMPDIVKGLKLETAIAVKQFGWNEAHARTVYNRSLRKQWNKLIVRDNCHPAKTMILLWVQIPLWICQSVAIRNLVYMLPNPGSIDAQIAFTQLTVGGFGWIPNLTEIDASYILPVWLGIINLAIIEIQTMTRTRTASKLQNYATNFFRLLSVIMVPVAAQVPACLSLYWVTSSAVGLTQNLLLLSPGVQRVFGIPKTPSEIAHPYRHVQQKMLERVNIFKGRKPQDTQKQIDKPEKS